MIRNGQIGSPWFRAHTEMKELAHQVEEVLVCSAMPSSIGSCMSFVGCSSSVEILILDDWY